MAGSLHGSARTTPRVRAGLQASKETTSTLAQRCGLSCTTVAKWRTRTSTADAPMGPTAPHSTVLTPAEEAMVVEFRRRTLLPLDDVLGCLRDSIPNLTRSSLHRCLERHDISRLPENPEQASKRGKFAQTAIGTLHIDSSELRLAGGKLTMVLAIDRVSKFTYVEFRDDAGKMNGAEFLRGVVEAFPYAIHIVLTDNGMAFADLPRNRNGPTRRHLGAHVFDRVCAENGIEHRLTKPCHPWTNGQAERTGRTVKDAAIKAFHYPDLESLETHVLAFVSAYNFAKHLKATRWKTPFEAVCHTWTTTPEIFKLDPLYLIPGLNKVRVPPLAPRSLLPRRGAGTSAAGCQPPAIRRCRTGLCVLRVHPVAIAEGHQLRLFFPDQLPSGVERTGVPPFPSAPGGSGNRMPGITLDAAPAASIGLFRRIGLFTRLLILVGAVSLPSFAVIALLVVDLHEERHSHLGTDALHEAKLVSNAVGSTTETARQLMLSVASTPAARTLDPACAAQVTLLHRALPAYAFIAVLAGDLRPVCGTGPAAAPSDAVLHTARLVLGSGGFVVDRYSVGAESPEPFLSVGLPVRDLDGRVAGVVVAGLSLEQMTRTLEAMLTPADRAILLADREGTVLARVPRLDGAVGQPFRPQTRFLLGERQPGVAAIHALDGQQRVVGFVPPAAAANGLYVGVGLLVEPADTDLVGATRRGVVFAVGAAVLALGAAIVFGQSYVRRPTAQLLAAAVRWRGGDLAARAVLREDPRTEFGSLAAAFNDMAEALGRQRGELEELNESLEGRVDERTRALSASHNRLQVQTVERELSDSRLRQAQKLQAVGELAGGLAHDFNNLLGVVVGSLDLLRRRVPATEVGQQQLIAGAIAAAERGARLTAQLIGFSRRQRLLPQPCDLNATVAAMRPMLATTLGPAISLVLQLDPALPSAMVDPNQLDTAILNLALNAREAMPHGGTLTVSTGASVRAHDAVPGEGGLVAMSVADTGLGIAADVLPRVFEPFFTTKGPGRGSGLGLSQVHGLAQQSGGDVRIASEPAAGTCVTLLLPRAGVTAAPASVTTSQRVLVVDDEADVRMLTAEMLEEDGHVVLVAADAEEALRLLEEQPVDLLLADYIMPGMNGVELLRRAAQIQPGLRVMLVTGYAELGGPGETAGLRTEQVLRKPFRSADLRRRVDLVLGDAVG